MAGRKQSRGACVYCGKDMTKSGMLKHLAVCVNRQQAIEAADGGRGVSERICHLQVKDAWGGDYWLNLEMPGSATLKDLDRYLRAIWLECCGHLSRFSVGNWGREIPMKSRIDRIFVPGVELTHIYDFGTSSKTVIQGIDFREGKALTSHPVALMARNLPPDAECMECDQPAKWLCMECVEDETSGLLCDRHREGHPHDNYGEPAPLVNSPRMGMCGYEGPAEPPY